MSLLIDGGCESVVCEFGVFFFQAEDGIRDLVRSRGLGDVYKRQPFSLSRMQADTQEPSTVTSSMSVVVTKYSPGSTFCLLYTSDAADERSSVDLGGRRIIKKKRRR